MRLLLIIDLGKPIMQKIVVAFDSLHFSESALRYAIYLGHQTKAYLVGVFLDNPSYNSFFTVSDTFSEDDDDVATQKKIKSLKRKDGTARANGLKRFATECSAAAIRYTIHKDNFDPNDLIRETIFADLLIINVHQKFAASPQEAPSSFIRSLLKNTHCPVLLIPDSFAPIGAITVLYNGDPSSVLALKMFNYLFPNFDQLRTQILCAQESDSSDQIPNAQMMKEWVQQHFSTIDYEVLPDSSKKQLLEKLKDKHAHSLIIAGAYQRSMVSMLLHPSLADSIIRQQNNPLFIAHY